MDRATNSGPKAMVRRALYLRGRSKPSCALALLLFARLALAQNTPEPSAPKQIPSGPPKITYQEGQLKIDALGATLSDVLTKVAALTGAKMDLPPGAGSERMPMVQLGPGPAREVLASLLSDSNFDYLIQGSEADPEKVQSVMLMVREKRTGGNTIEASVRSPRGLNNRASSPPPPPEEPPAPETPTPVVAENVVPETNPLTAPTTPNVPITGLDPSAPPSASQVDANQFPLLQQDPANPTRPGALTPPASLSPQSINQQLQQMYQQRVQMLQQAQQPHQ